MDDIRESIMELKYYKDNIFKASKSRMWRKKILQHMDSFVGKFQFQSASIFSS